MAAAVSHAFACKAAACAARYAVGSTSETPAHLLPAPWRDTPRLLSPPKDSVRFCFKPFTQSVRSQQCEHLLAALPVPPRCPPPLCVSSSTPCPPAPLLCSPPSPLYSNAGVADRSRNAPHSHARCPQVSLTASLCVTSTLTHTRTALSSGRLMAGPCPACLPPPSNRGAAGASKRGDTLPCLPVLALEGPV